MEGHFLIGFAKVMLILSVPLMMIVINPKIYIFY